MPPSWVSQLIDGYAQAYQVPDADRDKFRSEFRPVAERQVRRDLIIDAIAETEGLKASEADIDERVADVAAKRGAVHWEAEQKNKPQSVRVATARDGGDGDGNLRTLLNRARRATERDDHGEALRFAE